MTRVFTIDDFDFSPEATTAVVSHALKYVIRVPRMADGGEALVYPSEDARAGAPIHEDDPSRRGIVFWNATDHTVQTVRADGSGCIIINGVTEDEAVAMDAVVDAADLTTPDGVRAALDEMSDRLDLHDQYDTNVETVERTMVSLDAAHPRLMRRRATAESRAIRVTGRGTFAGPAASPQVFEDGAVLVQREVDGRPVVHLVQPDVFVRDYRLATSEADAASGGSILDAVVVQSPR